jgi:hypothetical protein
VTRFQRFELWYIRVWLVAIAPPTVWRTYRAVVDLWETWYGYSALNVAIVSPALAMGLLWFRPRLALLNGLARQVKIDAHDRWVRDMERDCEIGDFR